MKNRNLGRLSAFVVLAVLTIFSASNVFAQKTKPGSEFELMAKSIPGIDINGRKKPETTNSTNRARSTAEGFNLGDLPYGTYHLTFDAPPVSPAMAGKVEYLIVIQQFEVGGAANSMAKTYSEAKSNTSARLAIAKVKEGIDITVGPQPQQGAINTSKSNIKNSPPSASEARTARPTAESIAPQAMNVRGKIYLVEIGTTKMVNDQPSMK